MVSPYRRVTQAANRACTSVLIRRSNGVEGRAWRLAWRLARSFDDLGLIQALRMPRTKMSPLLLLFASSSMTADDV